MNDLLTRLREQFEDQYEVADNGCWLWTGPQYAGTGYGRMRLLGGMVYAHRISYELYVGAIPDGLVIDHQCDTRLCVNYKHLKPVTQQENVLRGIGLAAQHARNTHCLRGHLLDEDNIYLHGGRRHCRKCVNYRARGNQARTRRAAGVLERVIGPRSKTRVKIGV